MRRALALLAFIGGVAMASPDLVPTQYNESSGAVVSREGAATVTAGVLIEAGSTTRQIIATAHAARVGDILRFTTAGANYLVEAHVASTTVNSIILTKAIPAATVGDAFDVLRLLSPSLTTAGASNISGSIVVSNGSVSTTGAAVPALSTLVGAKDAGGLLQSLTIDGAGALFVNSGGASLDFGSTATAGRSAAQIGNATGAAAFGAGVAGAQVLRTVIASDQTAIPASQSGTWTVQPGNTANTTPWLASISQGGNTATVTGSSALKVDGSAVTQPVSAASLPLPTGAATSANQTTANSSLSSIDGKTPALGQTTMAGSSPVVIASNQSALAVTATSATLNYGTATAADRTAAQIGNTTGEVNYNFGTVGAQTLRTASQVGNATGAADFAAGNSSAQTMRVVVATDQAVIAVGGNVAAAATDSGNPVKIGGRFTTTTPALTTGQRGDAMLDTQSNLRVNTGGTSFVAYNTAQTGTVIKSGAGRLLSVCLMTKGANTDTMNLWDNTAASGTIISETTLNGASFPMQCARLDLPFATGLTITTVGATSRWTIVYQ